jgi:magnesium transporter
MIQVHVFRKGQEVRDVPVENLSEVRTEPQTLVWVDLVSPTPDELAAMGREFEIHEMALASCAVGEKQRPRVEEYEGQVLLIAYAAKTAGEDRPIELHELEFIAGRNFLLSFHGGAPIDATEVARRVAARPELAKHGSGFLLYVALDEVVDTFFPALDRIGERIEDLEEAVFEGTVARNLGAYAAIFAVVTMISGVYGMNFHHMPELGWRYGYGGALALMVVSATSLWIYFKRKGWL